MLDHQAIVHTRGFDLVGLVLFHIITMSFAPGQLEVTPHVWPGAGRTEISVQTLAAPGGLDNQDRFLKQLLCVNAKREFRSNLVSRGPEAGCHFACLLGRIAASASDR